MSSAHIKRLQIRGKARVFLSFVLVIVLSLPPVVNLFIPQARAANLSSYKVEIGNSQAAAATYHRFQFVTPSTTNIKTITFQYCTTPSSTCTAPAGMILNASPTVSGVTGIGGTTYTPTSSSGSCTGTGNTDCTLTLTVTTTAAQSAGATVIVPFDTGVTNPTTINTSYYVRITTKDGSAVAIDGPNSAAFAVLDTASIAVSASVDPNFTFTVAGVSSGGNFNGGTGNINVTSTATTIPFGGLVSGVPKIAAHDVSITTNANNGYTVTASHSATALAGFPPLTSGSNDIDAFSGTNTTPTTWSSPAGTTPNTNTGFFGYSTEDATLCTGTAARFTNGGAKWAGSTTTGGEAICSASAVTAQTTRIGWEIEVNSIQPGGAYTGTAILIATPTY